MRYLWGTIRQQIMNLFIETYGCQMNVADSEVVLAILRKEGYEQCDDISQADVILVNTCAIRDNAEQRIIGRLDIFRQEKRRRAGIVVGVLGCMAERLKEKLLEHPTVDIVAGPDSYRALPALIAAARKGTKQMDVLLSHEETYADIKPVRTDRNGVSAFISIMRGCDNICSYCVVPFTRGRERSRDARTIVAEAGDLFRSGYREVCLLGQNVDSYNWSDADGTVVTFARLLEMVSEVSEGLRVRFSTSYPNDISDDVLLAMARHPNICRHIHLPVQSGSDSVLKRMNRHYDRARYMERIARIREIIPDCAISTDVIVGFCGETPEDFEQTMSLFEEVGFDSSFLFAYSERPGTRSARQFEDDVPHELKIERLNRIIALQNRLSLESNRRDLGKSFDILVEGCSKRSDAQLTGRNSQNKMFVFDKPEDGREIKAGDHVTVEAVSCSSATLIGRIVQAGNAYLSHR